MNTFELQKKFDEFNELYFDGKIDHYQVKAVKPRVRMASSCNLCTRTIQIDNNFTTESTDYLLLKLMCTINGREHFKEEVKRIEECSHGKYTAINIIKPPLEIEGDKVLKAVYGTIKRGMIKSSGREITCKKVKINLISGKGNWTYRLLFTVVGHLEEEEMDKRTKEFTESLFDRINRKGSYEDFEESINCNLKYNDVGLIIGLK